MVAQLYDLDYLEKTRTDVLKVALRELLKRKTTTNININVKFDNRSISILT